jgi:hypothetical protein
VRGESSVVHSVMLSQCPHALSSRGRVLNRSNPDFAPTNVTKRRNKFDNHDWGLHYSNRRRFWKFPKHFEKYQNFGVLMGV